MINNLAGLVPRNGGSFTFQSSVFWGGGQATQAAGNKTEAVCKLTSQTLPTLKILSK